MEGLSTEEKALVKKSRKFAEKTGIALNPDERIVVGITRGLLRRKKMDGELYCPCRQLTGNKEKDKEIICPCIFHRNEIEKDGKCHCGLFVKK